MKKQNCVGIGPFHFFAQRKHGVAALLHIPLVLIVLSRSREELKVRMRGRNCSNQRHPNLP
jgi:hypothetical protein